MTHHNAHNTPAQLMIELHYAQRDLAKLAAMQPLFPQLYEATKFLVESFGDAEHCGEPRCQMCNALEVTERILTLIDKVRKC